MNFNFVAPLNGLSFGNVSLCLLREFYNRKLNPNIFPIGPINLNEKFEDDFVNWLNTCINKSLSDYKRTDPSIKLWHLNGAQDSISNRQILLTFYELNQPTAQEINIAKNQEKIVLTSKYSVNVFRTFGDLENVEYAPLGFDKSKFKVKEKESFADGRITFSLLGKLERRKHHAKVIQAWIKKYGKNPNYFLKCAIHNHFIPPQELMQHYQDIIKGQNDIFNVKFYQFMDDNETYNSFLNDSDIVIGMSGGEGWGLPEFQSVALGKFGVILNAHGYKEWATKENSILVEPNGRLPAYDGRFFVEGQPFNQGSIYTFDDGAFLSACDLAIHKVRTEKVNKAGLELQDKFSYSDTAEKLLSLI